MKISYQVKHKLKISFIRHVVIPITGVVALSMQSTVMAITPTFQVNQEIDFGILQLITGNCRMIATTGSITPTTGGYPCFLHEGSQNGSYTITANPNKTVQVRILPNLDHGDGIVFNPLAYMVSDSDAQTIFNSTVFEEIDSGASGIINISLGGDLSISSIFASGQTISFSFADAIEWDELP